MIYYTFDFKNIKYVVDLDFFITIIADQINDIDILLNELNINKIELEEFEFFDGFIYIVDNNKVKRIELTEILIDDIKKYFINFMYNDFITKKFNIQYSLEYSNVITQEFGFYSLFNDYFNDQELCYLNILNSGVESDITLLENFLELNYGSSYFIKDLYHNTKFYDESLIKSYSINELIINLIMYADKFRYDLNAKDMIKQLVYVHEEGE